MVITYRTTDLQEKTIDLSKAVDVTINGLTVTECKDGIRVSNQDSHINLRPTCSNSVRILKPKNDELF